MHRIFIGFGNLFAKTPFYEMDEEDTPSQRPVNYDHCHRAKGIHPSELFKDGC